MLKYQGPSLYDDFGRAVDVKDGLAVVSVGAVQSGGAVFSGALVYDAFSGQHLHTFVTPPGVTPSSLGDSVAIDQGLVVAGDRFATAKGVPSSGVAHVFDANTGSFVTSLFDNQPQINSFFGDLVAISGRDALVGGWDGKLVYFDAQTGSVRPKLVSPDPRFALDSVFDVDDGRALITATDSSGRASGIVIDLATRGLISVLQPIGNGVESFRRVALDGDRAILGAPGDDGNDGTAYIFDVSSGTQLHRITSPVPNTGTSTRNAFFGTDVDIDGDLAIVGFPNDSRRGLFAGGAYLYDVNTGELLAEFVASDHRVGDWFGIDVSIDNGIAIVGATRNQGGGATHGTAYIFRAGVVPEPSSSGLLLLGLLTATWNRRNRRSEWI